MGRNVHLIRADLAGNGDEGRAVAVGVGYSRNEVRRAGAEGRHADAGLAGQAAVDVGHEGRALLMADGDKFDFRTFQGVHDRQVFFAGNAEYVMDSLFFQAFDQ